MNHTKKIKIIQGKIADQVEREYERWMIEFTGRVFGEQFQIKNDEFCIAIFYQEKNEI